jgi:hypothetical protein
MAQRVPLSALAASAVVACASIGCGSSAAVPPYTPYQGINIDSESLVAPFGCGMGPGQVYRYVASVSELPATPDASDASGASRLADAGPDASHAGIVSAAGAGQVLATGVFDCFYNGVFEGLPPPPASFAVVIYAFTFAESAEAGIACDSEASPCVPPQVDAGAAFSGYSWTTTCTATEEASDSVFALCNPLQAPGAASPDAGANASLDAAASADATSEAAASVDASFDATVSVGASPDAAAGTDASPDATAGTDASPDGQATDAQTPADGGLEGGG